MKVINKKMCVVFVLVMLEIGSLFLMYKSNSNKEVKLDNVEIKEINNSGLAIMIEQSNGTYSQYTTNNNWPSDTTYVLNTLKSGCVDNDGNKIENGMTFDKGNRKIILNTNKTSNCYAYFVRSAKYKVEHASSVWNSNLTNDGYRYYGSSDSATNHVCFGTQSKSECVSDTDKYMYRIIGMFQEENGNGTINTSSDYHLKLIKKEALNIGYAWDSNTTSDTNWSASELYKGMNGDYFLYNMNFNYLKNNYWYSKITNWKWSAVNTRSFSNSGIYCSNTTTTNLYLDEMNRSGKPNESASSYDVTTAKIGIPYLNDYLLSYGNSTLNYTGSDYDIFNTSWMYLRGNDTNPPSNVEWLMARAGIQGGGNFAYNFYAFPSSTVVHVIQSVRPVFYLNSDVVICAGSGTSTDPYILG